MSRKIKDIKDKNTGELVYPRTHVSAVVLSSDSTLEDLVEVKQDKIDDLDEIRAGAAKGKTALQSYTEQYKGTITGVSANGTSIATSGTANIPAATTSKYGVTKLSDATNSTSTTLAATANAVKQAYDLANSYKGTVTSIKLNHTTYTPTDGLIEAKVAQMVTLNGTTIIPNTVGAIPLGNLATSVKIDNVSKTPSSGVVDLGYINKQLLISTSSSMTLYPNIYHRNTNTSLSTLTITGFFVPDNNNIINEYFVEFTTSSSGTTVSLPSTIKWANGESPTFEASTTYQISIVNNLGVVTKFK